MECPKISRENIINKNLNGKRYRAINLKHPCQYNWFNNMQVNSSWNHKQLLKKIFAGQPENSWNNNYTESNKQSSALQSSSHTKLLSYK